MKKPLVLLLISFIHHINIVLAQTQKLWESNITTAEANSDYPNEARKCVVDVDGNLYVLGHFNGNLTISGTTLSGANGDICLMKYDKDGVLLWAKRAGGSGNEVANDILLHNGYIYITGNFENTMNFNNPSSSGGNEIISAGARDGFLAKYRLNGSFVWAKRFGGTNSDSGSDLAAEMGNIYVLGVFRETANFNNPSSFSSNTLQSVSEGTGFNSADIFIAKFEETLGTLTWIRRAGGTNEDYPSSIAIDNTSIYITGTSRSGVLNFNTPSNTSTNILTNFFSGIFSGFLAKYNTSGTYQWSRRFGGDYYAWGKSVIAKDGNVYVAGEYSDDMSFSQNSYTYGASGNLISAFDPFLDIDEGFIAKYNSSGTIQWYKRSGGTINDMVLSEDGLSIYTIGKFAIDGVNFNNPSNYNSNTLFVPSSQYSKFYIYAGYFAKFNTDGAYQWSLQNSQSSDENLADELGTGISLKGSRIFTTAYARRNLGLIKCFFEGSISTNSLSGSSFCAGTNILVPFSTLGVFDAGNSFKVELSNAAGVFPTKNGYIGTGIVSPLTSTLPANASGTNYKVRVVSTNPVIVGSPTPIFGNGFDIIAASDAGTVTGGTTVCTGTNSTTLTLNNKVGNVLYWQGSVNPAFNSSVTTFNSTSTSLTLTDRTVGAYYRAVVQNGNCPLDYSASAQVAVSPTTVAGTLSSVNGIFCAGINNNTINLTGNVGNVLKWQSSSSSAFTSSVDINNTSSSLNVTNINTTTYYRAVVKSGACAEANTGNRQIAISSTAVTLNNSNPLNSVTFPVKSNFTITGQNAITGSSNVLFRSNKSVELKPGFRAESGTVFKAEIGGCN